MRRKRTSNLRDASEWRVGELILVYPFSLYTYLSGSRRSGMWVSAPRENSSLFQIDDKFLLNLNSIFINDISLFCFPV